jgi:hypothetical protein
MADFLKAEVKITHSENSDYSDPEVITNWDPFELTPDEVLTMKVDAETGGTTVETGMFTTITFVAVKNLDTTNFVDATFRTTGNGATSNIVEIDPGGFLMVSDLTPANDLTLTADTATCICKVFIAGT